MASEPRQARPGRRLRHRLPARLLATTVALSFATAPIDVVAATAQDSEIERLYVEGQDKYASGDFAGAADAWTRLLERLPEAQSNRATRENVLLNVLQARLDGYARTRKDDGSKDIDHLRKAKSVLDTYFAGFKSAYGDRAAVSAAVQEKADELDRTLEEAEKELAAASAEPEPEPEPEPGPQPDGKGGREIIVLEAEDDGGGLIVGGAVTGGLSLAGFGLLVAGGVIANRAEDDYLAATTDAERATATDKGTTGNALTITGAILGPVLLITGGVLVGLGIKKRQDSQRNRNQQLQNISVTPTGGRGFGGVVFSGRF